VKKTFGWFGLFLTVMSVSQAMAQSAVNPATQAAFRNTPVAIAPDAANPAAQATPQKTPGMPLIYSAVGVGTALIGNGFGTEGNPWIDTSTATLASGYGASFNPSVSFSALIGLNLDAQWSVNLGLEVYSFVTAQSSASNEVNVIPALRYTFDSGGIAPYVTAGWGFNFNTTSVSAPASILSYDSYAQAGYNTQSVSNTVASGGVGLLFKIAGDRAGQVYVEALYEQVFTAQGGFSYYPLSIGYQYP
jgi:hypothetical protein